MAHDAIASADYIRTKPAGRLDFMDAARAIMLLLGIPFHASEMYRISGGFGIDSPDKSFLASLISGIIHCFRMPSFFILSGFFAALILSKRDTSAWIKGRIYKLGVPLIATTLTLGIVEEAITMMFNSRLGPLSSLVAASHTSVLDWVGPRWFLITLLMFCICLLPLASVLQKQNTGVGQNWTNVLNPAVEKVVFLSLLAAVPVIAIVLGKGAASASDGDPWAKYYVISFVKYSAFFFFGVLLHMSPAHFEQFMKFDRTDGFLAGTIIALYLITYFAFYEEAALSSQKGWHPLSMTRIVIETAAGFYASKAFFTLMRRYFSRKSAVVMYIVDASFCIYLVHEMFLLSIGGALLNIGMAPMIEIVMICAGTLIGSTAVYELARRSWLLAQALNGGEFKRMAA